MQFGRLLRTCFRLPGYGHIATVRGYSAESGANPGRQRNPFLLLIFPATTFCLGTWQVYRLKWKRGLISMLESRTSAPPVDLPENILEPDVLTEMEYRRVRVTGEYDYSAEILLGPRSKNDGLNSGGGLISRPKTGYQVITPFVVQGGQRILINRGWIPKAAMYSADRNAGNATGQLTITGHIRKGEKRPQFVPKVAQSSFVWSYCDTESFSHLLKTSPILLEVDASSTFEGGPVGGQTRVQLRNEHMQYIITWYSLTAALLFMIYVFRKEPNVISRRTR